MTRAHIYTRFSDRPLAGDCDSCTRQRELCEQYCQTHDLAVSSVHADEAISGRDEDRPGLWAAVAAVGRGDVLLVYSLDRLARNVYLSELVHRDVAAAGGKIVSVTQVFDDADPQSKMIRQILQVFAEFERACISARTKAAMRHKQKAGQRMSRYAPYGFKLSADLTRLEADTAEAGVVGEIRRMSEAGASYCMIAESLNRRGVPARKGRWHQQKVKNVLGRE